ncbi:MAG: amidase [Gemmatimonadaceae bacterium]
MSDDDVMRPKRQRGADLTGWDTLGAFCRHTHVERHGADSGPLAGLTFGLKDLFDVAGVRTGFGSPDWLATHPPAVADTPLLPLLLQAGASLVGKTHTEEMAFSLTGENHHYGTPVNPAAPDRVPGGSSSGSASAVAGGLVDFAIGSDTGGSVRAPASYCGIYGLRPTHGRISLAGACPLAPSFDTAGWFARDAALLQRVGSVLLGPSPNGAATTPGRLLVATDAMAIADPAVAAVLQGAIAPMATRLGDASPVVLSDTSLRDWFDVFRVLQFHEIWATHRAWVTAERPTFGPAIQGRFEAVARVTDAEADAMRGRRRAITARLDAMLVDGAIVVLPTVPDLPPRLRTPAAATIALRENAMAVLCASGLAGLPQLSMPVGTVDGVPVGLSLLAARGNDAMLLQVATALGRLDA